MKKARTDYIELRNNFLPKLLTYIFILESPPVSGLYFYDTSGRISEPLFRAMMEIVGQCPVNKENGLNHFKNKGYFLVDATYKPVNNIKSKRQRDNEILKSYQDLVDDLDQINPQKNIPIILVKANICRLLEDRLLKEGFRVENKGKVVPFPSNGHQNKFKTMVIEILKNA